MGKNEIKLRRQMLSPGDIGRYRDYPALMKKHERDKNKRRYVRIFTYSILITLIALLFLIVISFIMIKWEKRRENENKKQDQSSGVTMANRPISQCV